MLPHVVADPFWFGIYFANICFLLPVFLAILLGIAEPALRREPEAKIESSFPEQRHWRSR